MPTYMPTRVPGIMPDQFSRTALLYGRENTEKLKNRRVAVFGLGGVGGHCAEALCRSGVGAIDLFDGDVVDITNINRQIIATHKTIGLDKVAVMRERLLDVSPDASITARRLFYLPETADSVDLSVFDYIVDAVDTITAKLDIICRAAGLGIPVISSMGAGNKLDPTALKVADIYETSVCPMARVMRSMLRKRGVASLKVVYSEEPPVKTETEQEGGPPVPRDADTDEYAPFVSIHSGAYSRRSTPASNAVVPPVAGLIIAGEVIRDLLAIP